MTSMLHLLCRWEAMEAITTRMQQAIRNGDCTEPFVATLYAPALELENAKRYTAKLYPAAQPYDPAVPLPMQGRGGGKLHIGYLSADFHRHATAYLISELFERHDRSRFEIVAYSYGVDDGSAERARIMNGADQFRDIRRMSDEEAATLIREDGIDILVDLKG